MEAEQALISKLDDLLERRHKELLQRLEGWMLRQEALLTNWHSPPEVKKRSTEMVRPSEPLEASHCERQAVTREPPQSNTVNTNRGSYALAKQASFLSQETKKSNRRKTPSSVVFEGRDCRVLTHVVRSWQFEFFFAIVIISNSAVLGVQLEWVATNRDKDLPGVFVVIDAVYAIIFTIELGLRILEAGIKDFLCSSQWAWSWLDTFVVLFSLIELGASIFSSNGGTFANSASNFRILRTIRVIRATRVLRVVRIARYLRSLRMLVYSIWCTLKPLLCSVMLLLMIMYVCGLLLTEAVINFTYVEAAREFANPNKYFGTLHTSLHTLFRSISGGISWTEAVESLVPVGMVWVYLFSVYIGFVYFAVLNVMTGIFCQSAISEVQRDQDLVISAALQDKQKFRESIAQLFKSIDQDGSGEITLIEFEEHFNDEGTRVIFDALELGAMDAWTLFCSLDTDGNHRIGIDEFIDSCNQLRGTARSVDLFAVKKLALKLQEDVQNVAAAQEDLVGVIRQLPKLVLERAKEHDQGRLLAAHQDLVGITQQLPELVQQRAKEQDRGRLQLRCDAVHTDDNESCFFDPDPLISEIA
eukprot:TRINITY_DN12805_c0_g1_i2.p1 TRINITY_DN12805_c0_g1~~TRINITY_DN12805_c0_g1_i2.p1  ORF type:complete len:604 (-),score=90.82 TRINITY_DN12805_c0_g1_i2:30-1790(-)